MIFLLRLSTIYVCMVVFWYLGNVELNFIYCGGLYLRVLANIYNRGA